MRNESEKKPLNKARILMFAQRNIYKKVHYRCYLAEFEDLICQMDSVELIAPIPNKGFKYGTRIAQRLASDYKISFNPGIPKVKIKDDYDLFFAFCQFPNDLLHIESIEGWKDRCKTSICWLSEIWVSWIYKYGYYLKNILSKFDHVILHWSQSVNPVNEIIGRKCIFLPLGIDAILFCPYPNESQRFIDVYSIGRKSEETHRTLINMFERKEIFYIFDSINGQDVIDTNQHRLLFANLAKRSKYFIVNPGKIDVLEETKGQSEIGNRYFEGAAAGTIMIGEHPKNEEFKKIFYWKDAVIHLPFGSNKIQEIISEFDGQPRRQAEIRIKNVVESLMRHDWAYRWETILKTAGLEPMPGLLERKKRLENLSKLVENQKNIL
jgi:hypothetical protein